MDALSLIVLGVTAFTATNIDDAFLLLLFFGDRRYRARHVFIGQGVGVGLLVLLSLVGALAALALPVWAVGLLGLLPIAIGARQLLERRRGRSDGPVATIAPAPDAAGWRQAAAVAGVALANGGDNVGVYVPLFAARPVGQTALLLAVVAVMLVVWTAAGYVLARRSVLAGRLRRLSRAVLPWVLIGLGVAIPFERSLHQALSISFACFHGKHARV